MELEVTDHAIIAKLDGAKASLAFHVEDKVMYLDSTYTPPQFRGMGIGGELVKASIEHARKNGFTIVPVCSFAVDYFEKHLEYSEILKKS